MEFLEKNKEVVEKIAQKYEIELFLLFGSRAIKNKAHAKSDFDVAYLSKNNLTLLQEASLSFDLSKVIKSEDIDLVNIKKASPLLFYAITRGCVVIYEKKPLIFDSLAAYAFKKYIETKPLYDEKFKRALDKIKKL